MKNHPNAFIVLLAGITDIILCSILIWIIGYTALSSLSLFRYILHVINMALTIPIYFILITYLNNGRTIGKSIFNLKVFNETNKKITFKQTLKRDGILLIPAFLYLAWHLPVIDDIYFRYEAIVTGDFLKAGGFVDDKIASLLAEILDWSIWIWIFLEFISILTNKEKKSIQDRLSSTNTLKCAK